MNLWKYLVAAANDAPNKNFLVKEKISYKKFVALCVARAATLKNAGVSAGDTVGILARNIPEYLISAFALWFLGARVLLLDNKLTPEDYERMTVLTDCKLVLAETRFMFDSQNFKFMDINTLDENDGADLQPAHVSPSDVASLSFTSGSTGNPKIVPLTHHNLTSIADALEDLRGYIDDGDDHLLFLPLYHIFGLAFITLHAIKFRGGVILETSANPRDLVQSFRKYTPRVVPAVPRILEIIRSIIITQYKEHGTWGLAKRVLKYQKFLRKIGLGQMVKQFQWPVHEMFGRSRATLIGGGAAVKPDVINFFESFGFDVLQGYGLTEASGPDTVSLPHKNRVVGSVGKTMGTNEFRITHKDKEGVGKLWLRGPAVFGGYLNNPTATAEVFDGEWFDTGDLAICDKNGEIHIRGRAKNIIVLSSGKNVFPDELEAKYITIPGVKNVIVVELNNKPFALFQTEDDQTIETINAGLMNANRGIGSYKQVKNFAITTEDFPATSSGKNKHFEAKKMLEDGKYPNRK